MSARNNNDHKNKKNNNNNNDNEEFPDELELQDKPQKVKKIQEPLKDEDVGAIGDDNSTGTGTGGEHDDDDESNSSDQEESEEDDSNLYDLMTDFFVNDNGENVATVLTNIQASLDQHAKCILKLTKVIQDIAGKSHK